MSKTPRPPLTADQIKSAGKRRRIIVIVVAVLVVFPIIGALFGSDAKTTTTTPAANASPLTKLTNAVTDEVGSSKDVRAINLTEGSAVIDLNGKDNLTEGLIKSSNRRLVLKAIDGLRTSGVSYTEVQISVYFPLTDKLGNTTTELVLQYAFTRDRILMINTEGVDVKDMDAGFADISTVIAPAFRW